MKEIMGIETAKKNVLTDAEREAILNDVICKDTLIGEVIQKGLLVDISGKKVSFKALIEAKRISFSTGNFKLKKVEERVNDHKMALVLSEATLQKFYVKSPAQFVESLNKLIDYNNEEVDKKAAPFRQSDWRKYHELHSLKIYSKCTADIIDINELIAGIKHTSDTIDEKKLNKRQVIFLKSVKEINSWIGRMVYGVITNSDNYIWSDAKKFERSISLGKSEVAEAWTDGKTYITIENRNLSAHPMKIVTLLVHEYGHNAATNESHDHGTEFYEAYHEVMIRCGTQMYECALKFQKTFNRLMLKEGVKPKKVYDTNLQTHEDFTSVHEQAFN